MFLAVLVTKYTAVEEKKRELAFLEFMFYKQILSKYISEYALRY